MRTPTCDELEAFFRIDGWQGTRSTGHRFFEKVLPDGELLRSHASFAGAKTMSPGRFKAILSDQLKVSEAEFWEALRTRHPVRRPSPKPEPAPTSLPAWLWVALRRERGLDDTAIAQLSEEEAHRLLEDRG